MKFYKQSYCDVIATMEKSAGNESVGSMWVDTKSFPKETPVEEIIKWADSGQSNGKLIITIDDPH